MRRAYYSGILLEEVSCTMRISLKVDSFLKNFIATTLQIFNPRIGSYLEAVVL